MILFYSSYCEHCTRLLDAIKRHDNNNLVKNVCIDTLRSQGYNFEYKIHSVPAMYFIETKEIIYGKAVFDYLVLPNRGKLLINNTNTKNRDVNISKNENEKKFEGEPLGFTIGNVTSQLFENINTNEVDEKTDINFSWSPLNDDIVKENTGIIDKVNNSDDNDKSNMPSMEKILQDREKALIF